MEFLDEETRPRFLFQSRPIPPRADQDQPNNTITFSSLHKPTLFISLSLSSLLFFLCLFHFQSEPLQSLFFWFALSFLLGPFAPCSITAGDIRVGRGSPLQTPSPPPTDENTPAERPSNRRSRPKKQEDVNSSSSLFVVNETEKKPGKGVVNETRFVEEMEWTEGDLELLKKQMVKNPVGKPGRWEAIAEAFNGRHAVESVIKTAKSFGEKRVSDSDSFNRFLKDRKPVDKRVEDEIENIGIGNSELKNEKDNSWTSGEDIALLNALKAFPKDVAMRWEKITAAVPGKSKAVCMKRVSELKRDFRSSKVSSAEA